MFCFFLISNLLISIIFIDFNVKNAWSEGQYSQTWPPVNNGQFDTRMASLNLSFIRHLFQTATFFRSHGWPLYTGLTVPKFQK